MNIVYPYDDTLHNSISVFVPVTGNVVYYLLLMCNILIFMSRGDRPVLLQSSSH